MWNPGQFRAVWDLSLVLVFFPVLVVVASAANATGFTASMSLLSGELSYALYGLHFPTLEIVLAAMKRIGPNWHNSFISGPIFVVSVLAACWLADRLYDVPIRHWFTRRLVPAFPLKAP
jgi:peptidoglycan/LPS O-acetylase OafA/YrhL